MSIDFIRPEVEELRPRISVIGVGGAGGNAIANMIQSDVQGVDFIVANTDAQALNHSLADRKIQLGLEDHPGPRRRLAAGDRQGRRRRGAPRDRAGARRRAHVLHRRRHGRRHRHRRRPGHRQGGARPRHPHRRRRHQAVQLRGRSPRPRSAEAGIDELQQHVDTLIVIPNQNLFRIANPNTTFKEAFMMADEVLQQGVRGITDLMVMPGLINLDFADVRSVMSEMGKAMMGTGEADGDNRAIEAAEQAIANPLLDGVSMRGAKGVIISITGGEDMRLMEVDEAANHIKDLVDPDANIIWGSAFNNDLDGKIRVSVVATGIDAAGGRPRRRPSRPRCSPSRAAAPPSRARRAEPVQPTTAPAADDRSPSRSRSRDAASTAQQRRRAGPRAADRGGGVATSCCSARSTCSPTRRCQAPTTSEDAGPGSRRTRKSAAPPSRPAAERGRHPVRAHVEHRPRRRQGAGRGRRPAHAPRPRPARHPALPQPAEQPIGSSRSALPPRKRAFRRAGRAAFGTSCRIGRSPPLSRTDWPQVQRLSHCW